MAWWSFILGSPKALGDVTETGKTLVSGIVDGIDALILTDEEKIQYNQQGAEIVLKYWDKVRQENSEQSKARRVLAVMTFKAFFGMIFLAITCRILAMVLTPFEAVSIFILKICLSGIVGGLVISIGTIYFGPHQLAKIVDFRKAQK